MKQQVTGVFTQGFSPVFTTAKIMRAVVKEDSTTMEHPLENGSLVADHRIINLIKIDLAIIVEAQNVSNIYKEIQQNFINGTLLTVQTVAGSYSNQFISELPYEQTPELYNAISIGLKLTEFRQIKTQVNVVVSPVRPVDSTTVNRGNQLPLAPRPASILRGFL